MACPATFIERPHLVLFIAGTAHRSIANNYGRIKFLIEQCLDIGLKQFVVRSTGPNGMNKDKRRRNGNHRYGG